MRRLSFLLLLCALPAFAQVYTVQDELTPLTRRSKVIFTGSGIACVDSASSAATTCTVSGGGGSTVPFYMGARAPGGGLTISSGTYATLVSGTLTQTSASQTLTCFVSGSSYSNATGVRLLLRLLYDGVATSEFAYYYNTASDHRSWSFVFRFTGAATAGAKTIALQWAMPDGWMTTMDGSDHYAVTCF